MRFPATYVFTAMCFVSASSFSLGQEPEDDPKAMQRDAWSKYYASQLPRYKFSLESSPDEPLELPDAKLRWSNPLRPGTHGDLFVWSHQGRGVLVGSVFSYSHSSDQRRVAHQFQSLSTESIDCKYAGGSEFRIQGPGLEFLPIPGAPKPAKNRVFRLTQMRGLSRLFKASCMDPSGQQPLRLLAQPIYRFESKKIAEDGAIFAFVMGTDPELLLVLSVVEEANEPKWHYAAARFASAPLELRHQDAIVWEYDDDTKRQGYLSKHGIDFQPNTPVVPTAAK